MCFCISVSFFFVCFISSFSNFVFCVIGILLCPKLGARYSVVVLSYCLSYFFFFVYCFKSGRSGFREWFPFLPCCLYLTLRYEVCSFLKAAYICSIRTLLAKCPICNHIRIHDTHVSLEFKVKNINGWMLLVCVDSIVFHFANYSCIHVRKNAVFCWSNPKSKISIFSYITEFV